MVENPVDSKYSVSQNESVAEPETETETLIQDDLLNQKKQGQTQSFPSLTTPQYPFFHRKSFSRVISAICRFTDSLVR